ncbi:MAG: hypothetical protein JO287_24095 [Pseudonocardiales bacterium]|nr:hypothetical protein [Pseudonocardiales bacterium]
MSTDQAPSYPRVLDELLPAACHIVEQYASNPIKSDHGRLKSRLRPMPGSDAAQLGLRDQCWARVPPEPPSRPLRTRSGCRSTASTLGSFY